jgi:hypothetical protein
MLVEMRYVCGSCGEEVVTAVDPSAGPEQEYVEDCPVCCRPQVVRVLVRGGDVELRVELEG